MKRRSTYFNHALMGARCWVPVEVLPLVATGSSELRSTNGGWQINTATSFQINMFNKTDTKGQHFEQTKSMM